jgi:outer membrane receptor protein involved in Fe transport
MLNEFSRQSDLQVLFDFNILRGMKTREVNGDLDPSTALKSMLKGTNLVFDFVNDRTLAVTPKKPSFFSRLWHRAKSRPRHASDDDELAQVLISGSGESGTHPLLGGETLQLGRAEIERSGLATTQDFLRTLPQVFGGGPTQDTVLGREAGTNSARGSGVNLRGLNAGATLVLIDGRRIAPSGIAGSFEDVSNIPLSIVDHVDVLPDGASARYGADAVGGVVNFVTRSNFSGIQTQARGGGVTNGSMGERQFSQVFGRTRDSGSDLLSFEYFRRDALRAQDRWQETSNLTPFGGSNFDFMYGSPGTITDGAHYWPLPKGQNGKSLIAGSLAQGAANLYDQKQGTYITPNEERWSVFGENGLKLTDDVGLFTEGLFTRRRVQSIQASSNALVLTVPQSNPFYVNPTGIPGPVTVLTGTSTFFGPLISDNRIDTGNFALGVTTSASHGWTASGSIAYTFEKQHDIQHGFYDQAALNAALADPNPSTAFNPFGDGSNTNPTTLAAISSSGLYDSASSLRTASLTARGATIALPGGDIEASLGTEYRIQSIETAISVPGANADSSGRLSRRIFAAFGELRIPLIGEGNEFGFAKHLELSLGARHENFSDVGSATIPKFGLFWSLSKEMSVRGTWTKSFRPPNLTDMLEKNNYSQIASLPDPSSANGFTEVLLRYGTNPELRPETARSWTLGADFAPSFLPGASLSLTYFNISYAGRIDQASLSAGVLSQPTLAWLVNRTFTQGQLNDACANSVFQGGAGTCANSSIGAIIDNRLRNISQLKTKGIDLIGKYSLESRSGRFDFGLNGTYLLEYSQANTPGSPLLDIVSTQNNPINFRARGSAAWSHRGFGVSTFLNFENSYRDTLSVPNRGVSPWTTVDLQLSYETTADTLSWLGHTQFALNAQNLFNVYPPFLNNPVGVGYDQENADLYGRLVSFEVRKRW